MKKFIILITLIIFYEISFAQPTANIPQYILEVKNFNLVNTYDMTFDLIFTHTDAIPLELAGWQFFFRVPVGIGTLGFLTGANSGFVYDSAGGGAISDLPVSFRPRGGSVANSGGTHYELRTGANTLPGAGNGLILPQGVPVLIGRYKIRSTSPLNPSVLYNNPFIIRDSCEIPLSVTRTKMNFYNEYSFNQEFTRCSNHSVNFSIIVSYINIKIKLAIEGLYTPVSDVSIKKETITAYLRNAASPYQIIDSSKSIVDSISHTGNFAFHNHPTGIYYFSVKNKNILETWSEAGGTLLNIGINNYDFTSSASKAYGNNMVLKGNRYCIYSGNFNNDNIIDTDDLSILDNDLYNYATGSALTNINGDNIVDIDDLAIVDKNAENLVIVQWPGLTYQKRQVLINNKSFTGGIK